MSLRPLRASLRRTTVLATALTALLSLTVLSCGGGTDELSGTYVAKTPDGPMTLVFKDDNQVSMTMGDPDGGEPETQQGQYLISGDKVTISLGFLPMELTIKDDRLEGIVMGQVLIFEED